jgi:cbb3-type cytochrome oxidase cytochrome c subunit
MVFLFSVETRRERQLQEELERTREDWRQVSGRCAHLEQVVAYERDRAERCQNSLFRLVEVQLEEERKRREEEKKKKEEEEEEEKKHEADLYEQLLSYMDACVYLEFEDGEARCHTFPLAARSPVFRAMLTADMRERASGRIRLKDMKLKTGKDLLFYLYNRKLRDEADVMGLLAFANQYDMQELKIWCGKRLAPTVTKANYSELWRTAELYDSTVLKSAVLKYIASNVELLAD